MKLITFLITTLGIFSLSLLSAQTADTNEIIVRFQTVLEADGKGLDQIIEDLNDIDRKDLSALLKQYDRNWPRLRDNYLKAYKAYAKKRFSGSSKSAASKEIRQHRADFMRVYQMSEAEMKPLLKTISMPALTSLRTLIMPSSKEVLALAPVELLKQRDKTLILAKFRDGIVDAALISDEPLAYQGLIDFENETITSYSDIDSSDLKVLKNNIKIGKSKNIPAEELVGIREANEWRILVGLNALTIDPKLCNASRGHSEDMNRENFFAHESPVKGKKTPWDRASKAGTKARGENIYVGRQQSAAANKGWFFSPGHHKNLFKNGHKTIGLGQYQKHWTQMFG